MAEPPFDLDSAHRLFGIELNNQIMDALEAGRVTPETSEPFIHAAHASCHHWMEVGTVANHGRGEFAVASVYAAAGLGEAALRHARRCLELVEAHPGEMADLGPGLRIRRPGESPRRRRRGRCGVPDQRAGEGRRRSHFRRGGPRLFHALVPRGQLARAAGRIAWRSCRCAGTRCCAASSCRSGWARAVTPARW